MTRDTLVPPASAPTTLTTLYPTRDTLVLRSSRTMSDHEDVPDAPAPGPAALDSGDEDDAPLLPERFGGTLPRDPADECVAQPRDSS